MKEPRYRFWNTVRKTMTEPLTLADIWHDAQDTENQNETDLWSLSEPYGNGPGFDIDEGDLIPLQFTGLKDKNGVEIYEGDIVLAKDHGQRERWWGVVRWQLTGFNVSYHRPRNTTSTDLTNIMDEGDLDHWEVIGNIYENPDLLKAA